jgi:hypothetical protein
MALTPDEDEELRRIHVLSQFGELPETMRARFRELRSRDTHLEIAEPTLDIVWVPRQQAPESELADLDDVDDLVLVHKP